MSMNENKEGILVNQNATAFYLHVTDKDAVIPSFFISKNDNFLFHAQDSVNYYVADGKYRTVHIFRYYPYSYEPLPRKYPKPLNGS